MTTAADLTTDELLFRERGLGRARTTREQAANLESNSLFAGLSADVLAACRASALAEADRLESEGREAAAELQRRRQADTRRRGGVFSGRVS